MKAPKRPAYLINMALAPLAWTPECWQMRPFINPSRANSVWLGTVWNVILIPTRIWHEVLRPLLHGEVRVALFYLFLILPATVFQFLVLGLQGALRAHSLPLEVCTDAEFLEEWEAALQMRRNDWQLVKPLR